MQHINKWRRLNGDEIQRSIADEITEMLLIERAAGNDLKVCIGTDSQVKRTNHRIRYCNRFPTERERRIYVHPQFQYTAKNEHQRKDAGRSRQKY
jgi:hypothetical protein